MTLRVIVVDDEPLARKRMRRLLAAHPDLQVVGEATNGDEAVGLCLRERPDLLFLDVRMPGASGVEALRAIRAGLSSADRPQAVFTTAHGEHAVEAFELEGADYLLKPIDAARLERALQRVRERLGDRRPAAPQAAAGVERIGFLAALDGNRIVSLAHDEVAYLAVEGSLTWAVTARGRLRVRGAVGELEARLPTPPFVRVSRSCIVHLAWIEDLRSEDSGTYTARLRTPVGGSVAVSRRRARPLRELLGW